MISDNNVLAGSLQVLKSGEIIHLQKIPKTNNNVTQTASKVRYSIFLSEWDG